jgi:hypothetical protein
MFDGAVYNRELPGIMPDSGGKKTYNVLLIEM